MVRLINLLAVGVCSFAGIHEYSASLIDHLNIALAIVNFALYVRPLNDCEA